MSSRTLHERVEEHYGVKFIRLKSGRLYSFFDANRDADRAYTNLSRALARMFKLSGSDEWDIERLEWFIENIESYMNHLHHEIEKKRGVRTKEERIAALRQIEGRTPEEAAEFLRKADQLQQRLENEQS